MHEDDCGWGSGGRFGWAVKFEGQRDPRNGGIASPLGYRCAIVYASVQAA